MVRFFIAGIPRTGTTLIRTTLNSHPRVRCIGEAFLFGGRFVGARGQNNEFSYRTYLTASPMRRAQDVLTRTSVVNRYLDEMYAAPGFDAIGFKLMESQDGRFPMVMKYLRSHDARVIHVVRKNVLKTLISRSVSKITQRAHSTEAVAVTQVTLNAGSLVRRLEKIHQSNENYAKRCSAFPYLRVIYEEFVADKARELKRMLEFLDVEYIADLKSSLVKVNPNDIRDIITNYDEVCEALRGSKFEWCLTA